MHELPITERMLNLVLGHARTSGAERVLTIHLELGAVRGFESEWIIRYFEKLSRGTEAEGAELQIDVVPIALQCSHCASQFGATLTELRGIVCPDCGRARPSLVRGDEYRIKSIEVV